MNLEGKLKIKNWWDLLKSFLPTFHFSHLFFSNQTKDNESFLFLLSLSLKSNIALIRESQRWDGAVTPLISPKKIPWHLQCNVYWSSLPLPGENNLIFNNYYLKKATHCKSPTTSSSSSLFFLSFIISFSFFYLFFIYFFWYAHLVLPSSFVIKLWHFDFFVPIF